MVKGWDVNGNGTYYFDYTYGAMLKGSREIDGVQYAFNRETGIMESCSVGTDNHWAEIGGVQYWYEGGIRQGYDPHDPSYRGRKSMTREAARGTGWTMWTAEGRL